ncbi:uncharacterized protein [Engystomops pustulosus]|uniref:uncharacterized protein isoform X1 n=1 Tax=Engystomops pustulosus TaxID=76066 RepID=UPI003AFACD72
MAAAGGKIQPRRHLHRPGGLPYSRKPEQHQRQSGIFGQLTAALGSIVPYIKNLFVAPQQEPGRYLRLKTRPPLPPAPKTCMDLQERKDLPVPEPTVTSGEEQRPIPHPRRPSSRSIIRSAPYAKPSRRKATAGHVCHPLVLGGYLPLRNLLTTERKKRHRYCVRDRGNCIWYQRSATIRACSISSESLEDTEAPVPSHEKDIREDKVRRGRRPCAGEKEKDSHHPLYGLMTKSDSQQQESIWVRTGSGIFNSEKSYIRGEVQLQLHIGNPKIPRSLPAREIITLLTCASG